MNARLASTFALAGLMAATLPARAADPELLNLVMPDAAVLAGVNVDQAKTSAFGQYVLSQVPMTELQKLTAATGFDPTRDLHEVLAASGAPGSKAGLVLARGTFNPSQIAAAAAAHGGTTTETYGGVTILEDAKQTHGVAFLSSTLAVAGDVASVKGAIDRQKTPASLPASVLVQVNQWSGTEDAWAISTVPPSTLHPASNAPKIPGVGPGAAANAAFQAIQSAAGGVKFGDNVVVTAQATADNAQDAENLAGAIKLLAAIGQMQAADNQALKDLTQSLSVTVSGTVVKISVSMPESELQSIVSHPHTQVHKRAM
jgi:hypothetical protein